MKYYLDPFGCVKNQVDAETMMASLNSSGWESADDAAAADLLIINSCGFIESAKKESLNAVFSWRKMYPEKKILLAGCLAQRYGGELSASLPEADAFFGNRDLSGIAAAAALAMGNASDTYTTAALPHNAAGVRPLLSLPGSAYVKISEGCNNHCTFCSIPLIRGPLQSRPPEEVFDECIQLLGRGIKELCIIGQDIASYNGAAGGLIALMENLKKLPGHFWVRLLYIHPDHFPANLPDICASDPRFLPYFDLPFQHGSEKILRAMNRRGTADSYLRLIENIRSRLPSAVIRSTFLLGFPGETGDDFNDLLNFQKEAKLDWAGCFAYSREEDTAAFSLPGRVSKKLAAERKKIVEMAQVSISEARMERFVGMNTEVLVEEQFEPLTDGPEMLYLGRLFCQAPEVDGSAVIRSEKPLTPGALLPCKITGRLGFDLEVALL
ncbi:ribosomal protein S12 methylthiotransferase RimO [Spirochaetia bacterium]|nr:ribosomal protein S12 methylthiotransferase RimO [Spirochaetia bacterium]